MNRVIFPTSPSSWPHTAVRSSFFLSHLALCILVGVLTWGGMSSTAHAACDAPNLLLVLDRSCSMAGTNWNTAVNAAKTVTNRYNGKLRFGLETFNSSASINYSLLQCISDRTRCVSNLQYTLSRIRVSGGTNLRRAIDTARSHLSTVRSRDSVKTRKMSVMFITDGQASCADSNVRTLLQTLGVKTYVIGFGRGVDSNCLNKMAVAGDTARSGSRKYYQADNSAELNNAMNEIANSAAAEVCNNLDDDCDGRIDEGLYRSCRTSCGTGTEYCSRGSWVGCSARQPTSERCNGYDDDCDGRVDENWSSKGGTCYVGTGNCRRSGRYICNSSGTGLTCSASPGSPVSEKCNGQDDDCDGSIDENWPQKGQACTSGQGICARSGNWVCNGVSLVCSARPGTGRTETCNNIDDDCDGSIDEGVTRTCRSSCGTGTEYCSRGRWGNCNARQPTTERCNGIDDDCDGQVDENWSNKNDVCYAGTGACRRSGQYVCNSSQTGTVCSATAGSPSTERCNGIDDDCDGQIDENFPTKGNSCTVGQGNCSRPGRLVCHSNGTSLTCAGQPGTPVPEKCNGQDDDCDGQVDENWPTKGSTCSAGTGSCQRSGQWVCRPDGSGLQCSVSSGQPTAESCNNIDDDCDGSVDEGLTRACSTQCNSGTETCSAGQWVNCTARKPVPETCNGRDDDCDGQVDENWPTKSQACSDGIGECKRTGQWVCSADNSGVECSVKAGSPSQEQCNGKDDDCDGQVDENWSKKGSTCSVGVGECQRTGQWVCSADNSGIECSVKPGTPVTETCNNKDDNCDGSIDENLTQSCKTICESGTETCQAGQWINCTARKPSQEVCNGRDDDCNGQIDELWPTKNTSCDNGIGNCERTGVFVCKSDGSGVECSAQPGTPTKEVCNGQDDDCDGQIDEDWSKLSTPCAAGVGECISTGIWICKADGISLECSAKPGQPQTERCNGKDDNCDGKIDETWSQKGQNCTLGLGICQAPGVWVCKSDESDVECNAKEGIPQAETCNNKDDDCDGTIDEALLRPCRTICGSGNETCQAGQWVNCDAQKPVAETCNGKDDDCNGLIDDKWPKKGTTCAVGVGACERKGTWQCNAAGDNLECSATPGQPQTEQCDDIDNDCDGQIDEDWPDKGQSCKAGTGACNRTGQMVCTPDGTQLRCSSPGGAPSSETCDGVDNDCNGQIDDGLARVCNTVCGSGVETCIKGRWQNCTADIPKPEICNGKDDDCNGTVDQGLTRVCETACGKGKETCVNGRWQNCTAPQPQQEVCDAQDNDCDGEIDELPPKQCLGDCGQGQATCNEGAWTGCSGPPPQTETCNGKDDDCNGRVDDNLSRPCRSDCGPGTEICQGGQWTLCNAPKPQPEICNGRDDNCDGKPDDKAPCPQGLECVQGSCRPRCRNGECPGGLQCVKDVCFGDACQNVKCPSDKQCVGGRCVSPCELIQCPSGHVCRRGNCVKDDCYIRGCPSGQRCYNGVCQKDPCDGVSCGGDQFCRDGKCVSSCAGVKCNADEYCEDGKCKKDPGKTGPCKDQTCPDGHTCKEGKCLADPCYNTTCHPGQACKDGRCQHDPCHNIRCPDKQTCRQGQCHDPDPNAEPGPKEGSDSEVTTDGGVADGPSAGQDSSPVVDQDPQPTESLDPGEKTGGSNTTGVTEEASRYAPGCGCQQPTGPFSLAWLLALLGLFLPLLRRRTSIF